MEKSYTRKKGNASNYIILNGLILDANVLKPEDTQKISDLLNPYGPFYQPSRLEELLEQVFSELERRITPLYGGSSYHYKPRFESKEDLQSFLKKTERVIEVDYLYEGSNGRVLGLYDILTDTIFVLKELIFHFGLDNIH